MIRALLFACVVFVALAYPRAANATACTVPNLVVNGQYVDATKLAANFSALAACSSSIDNTNIGAAGIYASQIIPTTVAQATFGGTLPYTFPSGVTANGQVTATSFSTGGFVILGTSSQSLLTPSSSSAPLQFSNAGNTVINTIFADAGGEQLVRGNLTLNAGNVSASGTITAGGAVTGSTLNLTNGAVLFMNGSSIALTGGSSATSGFYFANAVNTAAIFSIDNSGDGSFQGTLSAVGALSGNSVSSASTVTAGTAITAGTTITATGNITGAYGIFSNITATGNITGAYGIYTNIADSALSANDCVQTTGTTLISAPAQCMVSISGGNKTLAITGTLTGFSCAAGVSCSTTLTGSWGYTFGSQPNCQSTLESSSNPPLIVRCAATTTGYTINFYNAGGGAISSSTEVVDILATGS